MAPNSTSPIPLPSVFFPTFFTAVGLLQQAAGKIGANPLYFFKNFGPKHRLTFTCEVKIRDFSIKGAASKKKLAKRAAAFSMLRLLQTKRLINLSLPPFVIHPIPCPRSPIPCPSPEYRPTSPDDVEIKQEPLSRPPSPSECPLCRQYWLPNTFDRTKPTVNVLKTSQ